MPEILIVLDEIWVLLPTRVVGVTVMSVAASPSTTALAAAAASESVCHSWYVAVAFVLPIELINGVSVGATDRTDRVAYFSNYGPCVTIYAPGVEIVSASYLGNSSYLSYNGTTGCNGLVRLLSTGLIDLGFTQGGFDIGSNQYSIRAIHVLPSGDILVGGDFTTYKGNTRNGIVKIDSTGTVDYNIFGTGVADIINVRRIYDIATLATGEILIGGFFQTFNGETRNNFVKLNADGTFHTDTIGFNDVVRKILVKGSFIYIGGQFTSTA